MKQNKYQYLKVIQAFVCGQWCDYTAYDKNDRDEMEDLRNDLKAYRENKPYPLRVISRRMLATEKFHA